MEIVFGTDESIYQPTYDGHYQVLASHGGSFDIPRAGQGASFVDAALDDHYANDAAAGLKRGLYHWMDPERSGRENADYFSRIIDQFPTETIWGDVEQWWDWKTWSLCYEQHKIPASQIIRLPASQIYDCTAQYFDILKTRYRPGKEIGEYTAKWFLDNFQAGLKTWEIAKDLNKWLAQYVNQHDLPLTWDQFHELAAGLHYPVAPAGWENVWDIWQISSSILLPGMPRIDLNIVNPASRMAGILGGQAAKPFHVYVPVVRNEMGILYRCYVNCSWLTVCDGPGMQYKAIAWLPYNTPLDIFEEQNGWGHILDSGWVNLKYTRR